jgi:starch synthase
VQNYDERAGAGTGFVIHDLYPSAIANTMGWALSTYFNRPGHIMAMRRLAMQQDFSWARAAQAYEQLYLEAYQRRRGHPFNHG